MQKPFYTHYYLDGTEFGLSPWIYPKDISSSEEKKKFQQTIGYTGDFSNVNFSLYSKLYNLLSPCFNGREAENTFRQFWNGVSNILHDKYVAIGPKMYRAFQLYMHIRQINHVNDLESLPEINFSFEKRVAYLRYSAYLNMLDIAEMIQGWAQNLTNDLDALNAWINAELMRKMINYEISLQYEIAKNEVNNYESSYERFERNITMIDTSYDIWRSEFERYIIKICPAYIRPNFREIAMKFEESKKPIINFGPEYGYNEGRSRSNPWNSIFGYGDEAETAFWNTE